MCLYGMLLAQEMLPDAHKSVELVFEDNGGSPAKSVSAYQKLRASDAVRAVVVWEDAAGLALAPLTESHEVVLVVTAMNTAIVKKRKYAFLYWLTPDTEIAATADEAARRGYRRLARIVSQHPGPLFLKSEFDRVNNARFQMVLDSEVPADSRDFRPFLLQLKQQPDVDALLAFVWYGQIGLLAKQARQLGVKIQIVGHDIYEDQNELKLAEGALEGTWFVQIADPLPSFEKEYKERFPKASLYSAGNCYDIVRLIAEALRRKENVAGYLAAVKNYPGALGVVSASGDHRFIFPALIREVAGDGFRTVFRQESAANFLEHR
jgi:branched-chain amino acid transport system substrate-binding protein